MVKRYLFFITASFSLLASCKQGAVSTDGLVTYVMNPDHGLIKKEEKNGTVLEVYYKPSSLVIRQQNLNEKDTSRIHEAEKQLGKHDYFVLSLQRGGKQIENGYAVNPNRFNEVVNYLAYYIAEDIKLIHGKDTIPVTDIAYGRTFGASKKTDVLMVFNSDLKKRTGIASLVLTDHEFGTGTSQFDFDLSDLRNIPPLKPIQ